MNDIQEYKLNVHVHVEPIAGFYMDELAIKCVLFVLNKFKKKLVVKSASF